MANVLRMKRSAVAGKVPLTTDLQLGELAVNTYDGRLYTKKDNGSASIVEVPSKFSSTIGNGSSTSIAVTHNLGTKDVSVTTRQTSDDMMILTDWVATDANTVTLTFNAAPASNSVRVVVIG